MTTPNGIEADESQSIAALAAALAKAQGQMKAAAKSSLNPHFKSKYANLAAIWEAAREALSSNGLAVMQRVSSVPDGVLITTQLVHSSGEWVRDRCVWPVAQKTPQGMGSAITYGKRYALAALVGVAADEDDDGNAASAKNGTVAPKQSEQHGMTEEDSLHAIASAADAKALKALIPQLAKTNKARAAYTERQKQLSGGDA